VLGPDRRLIGILSERDIVRVLAERGASMLPQPLAAGHDAQVVTCSQSDTVGVLMELMTTGKFRHLPVIEDEKVIGVGVDRRRGQAPAPGNRAGIRRAA